MVDLVRKMSVLEFPDPLELIGYFWHYKIKNTL